MNVNCQSDSIYIWGLKNILPILQIQIVFCNQHFLNMDQIRLHIHYCSAALPQVQVAQNAPKAGLKAVAGARGVCAWKTTKQLQSSNQLGSRIGYPKTPLAKKYQQKQRFLRGLWNLTSLLLDSNWMPLYRLSFLGPARLQRASSHQCKMEQINKQYYIYIYMISSTFQQLVGTYSYVTNGEFKVEFRQVDPGKFCARQEMWSRTFFLWRVLPVSLWKSLHFRFQVTKNGKYLWVFLDTWRCPKTTGIRVSGRPIKRIV